jgi:glutathione peroxidase
MRIALTALATASLAVALPAAAQASAPVIPAAQRGPAVLSGTYQRLDGDPINLARLRGRVVLVVNTASHCGYTDQYGPLEALWRKDRARGLTVLGVPSKDFQQELPTDAMVKRFCKRNFGVTFPMLRISKVTGPKAVALFRGLASPSWSREPQWNFNKYLVDSRGRPAMYFPSSEQPDSPAVRRAIDALLTERT